MRASGFDWGEGGGMAFGSWEVGLGLFWTVRARIDSFLFEWLL